MTTSGTYTPPPPALPQQVAARAVTDASGEAVFTWPPGTFTDPPVVTLAVETGGGFHAARITGNTAAQTAVSVLRAAGVTLLGIGVLATGTPAGGVTVHATATAANAP